jgi:hypothetical protein
MRIPLVKPGMARPVAQNGARNSSGLARGTLTLVLHALGR